MDELAVRLSAIVRLLVPFVLFMAWIYLGLHILVARLSGRREGPVLWFFSVVTGPLTRPVRALLPPATPEPRVRLIGFAVYVGLWLVARTLLGTGRPSG